MENQQQPEKPSESSGEKETHMDVVKSNPVSGVDATVPEESINLRVMDQSGGEVYFKLKPNTVLQKLFDAYCTRQSLNPSSLRFLVDGQRVKGDATPKSLELTDNDIIDVVSMQVGG